MRRTRNTLKKKISELEPRLFCNIILCGCTC